MDKSWRCCVFILITALAAWCSVAEILSKSVCIGDSVQLFQNITLPSLKIKVTLYKDGGRNVPIAVWLTNASGNFALIQSNYKSKVLLENGSIMLRNIQSSDEAIYSVVYEPPSQFETNKAQIWALAPPAKPCKLKLRQEDNHLIAFLDNLDDCGKPVVSVHWLDYPGISNESKVVLELKPGNDACNYYACFEGEALTCTRKSTELKYCEYITGRYIRKDNIPTTSSDSQPTTTTTLVIVVIVLLVVFFVIVLTIVLWKYRGREHDCLGRVCSDAERSDQESPQDHRFTDENSETMPLEDQDGTEVDENTDNSRP